MNLAKKSLCGMLVVSVAFLSIDSARAEVIATERAITVSAQASRQALLAYLGRADVASQLHSLGVEPAFAQQRVAAMSDEEIGTLIGKLGSLPAAGQMAGGGTSSGGYGGGGGSAFLVILLVALLVVWLIYIVTPRSPAETLNSSF
ncbi:MAG TPA: PA2779 family protein [Burkholderiales bacterium]|nr:PA2779 family protein [Burkholderiales bacterium]